MDHSGVFQFHAGTWFDCVDGVPAVWEPWLLLEIHDSTTATLRYAPVGRGTGRADIGTPPAPADRDNPAAGLADWWADYHQLSASTAAKEEQLLRYFTNGRLRVRELLAALELPEIDQLADPL